MKKMSMIILVFSLLLLTGCRSLPFGGQSRIEWVDFIKLNGKEYNGIYSGVLADEDYVGEQIGTVKFKVVGNVTNPNYKIKNGDAAFHDKGTVILKIKNHSDLIAVKDTHTINGYKVYYSREDTDYKWHFKDMPIEKVDRIEIYHSHLPEGDKLISELTMDDEINSFLQLLVNSEENPNFQRNLKTGDPTFYKMIFYTEAPIAYQYYMQFDGDTYFWHPWDTSIISDEMKLFIIGN
ncbi:hypothetical protein QTL97_13960 [Sporosarcina thermotolerans]|uniref:DUF3298 domain-containing protein n=1 Tax=Sporosarcina thermotolerans TaxID=633404 RepID=A0AAW9AG60_9BACL|nr:hypothetical protein [Sporosarcina thermotolerans]MDW0118046.1 hypothetical protein [Sporosarcina thermotolerans]WHT49105.1 hypothetical protein QNH10_05450 [Sporosarcina thermotolerans]